MREFAACGSGLLWVSLLDEEFIDRDRLIEEAYLELERELAEADIPFDGPSTWRFYEAGGIEGFEWWPGQLLIATVLAVLPNAGAPSPAQTLDLER